MLTGCVTIGSVMDWWLVCACVLPALGRAVVIRGQGSPINLHQGPLLGIKQFTELKVAVNAYLGIPYALPPVGELRFAPPERHPGWERPLFASTFQPTCPQPAGLLTPATTNQQDEDCLYLNIWATDVAMNYRNTPVIVFFEGEGFVAGSPSRFSAQDLAAEGIIVVSVAYRLNIFGFFSLGILEARGNLGILDQYLALVWVHDNIASFGGNPRSVTLMGHSAGAASVIYHMISPRTANLFHRAIVMSGSVLSPWSYVHWSQVTNSSRTLARSLGCLAAQTQTLPLHILTCLRNKTTTEILRAFETQYLGSNWTNMILPTSDKFLPNIEQYLPNSPLESLKSGSFLKIPVLTGTTSHDGIISVAQWGADFLTQGFDQLLRLFINTILPTVLTRYGFQESNNKPEILSIIKWQYLDGIPQNNLQALVLRLINFYSDVQFKVPHVKQLHHIAKFNPDVYAYEFKQGEVDLYGKEFNISGASHGTELVFLFGPSLIQSAVARRFTSTEERLSIAVKRIWTEFVRQGSLGSNPYGYGLSWRRYDSNEDNYFVLKTTQKDRFQIQADEMAKYRISLWNNLIPTINNISVPTHLPANNGMKGMHLTSDQPYRSAMYTLIGFVIVLFILLIVCVILLKRSSKERERELF